MERFSLKFGLFYSDGWIYSHFKRRAPSAERQARLYHITERFAVFTAGPGFPFTTVAAVTLFLCSRQGSLRFEANRVAAWVLHPHLSKDRPLSVPFLTTKAAATSPSANSCPLRSGQEGTVKKKILLYSTESFQKWSLLHPIPSMSQCN